MKGRRKIIQGATSSGKTYGIIPILYDKALAKPNTLITVVAETIPALKNGAVKIFKDFLYDEGRWVEDRWIANPMEYTLPNRSKIQFTSFDTVGKAKAAGKRELLFMNEANHIPYPIADALMIRSKEIWLDFNADSEFWAHTELMQQPNTEFLKLTYLDNEAIPPETLEDLLHRKEKAEAEDRAGKRGYWWNWWQVYGLGEVGNLEGVIFNDWGTIDQLPLDPNGNLKPKFIAYGIDFGYTNDPTAIVLKYELDGVPIWDEICYQKGLSNSAIANILKQNGIKQHDRGYADSAEPKSIDEINLHGFSIKPVEKGSDSINFGISVMQEKRFLVTSRSVNIIKELRNYKWDTDKTGKTLNRPVDFWNHAIDSMRYVEMMLHRKPQGNYNVRF